MSRQVGHFFVALSLLIAGLVLPSEQAHAHGGENIVHQPISVQSIDKDHAEKNHPGHCHGGSFCNGVAVTVGPFDAPQPVMLAKRQVFSTARLRLLAVTFFDPPPPRPMS